MSSINAHFNTIILCSDSVTVNLSNKTSTNIKYYYIFVIFPPLSEQCWPTPVLLHKIMQFLFLYMVHLSSH